MWLLYAVFPHPAVVTCVCCVDRDGLSLHLRETTLLHELLHLGRATHDSSGVSDTGSDDAGEVRVDLTWLSLHGSKEAVKQRCGSTSARWVPEGEGALDGAGAGVHAYKALVSLLGGGPLPGVIRPALRHEFEVVRRETFGRR